MAHSPSMTREPAETALEQRIAAELAALRAWLRRAAGPETDDIVQETVARALRYRASFDASREVGPWLRATALRVLADHRAQRARAPLELHTEDAPARPAECPLEVREDVERALARLSVVEREVLQRFHGLGHSVREIASALGLPEGTVKSHLHRARQRLIDPETTR